jgi:hypothetical protein
MTGKISAACEMRTREEIETILREEIKEVLDELSDPATGSWTGGAASGAVPGQEGSSPAY